MFVAKLNNILHSVNNLCKKGDRKGRPYEYACTTCVCRGDLYGRPYVCTDYLQKDILRNPEGIVCRCSVVLHIIPSGMLNTK
jgi:hypothetical protein